jgi:hypothetical protein
VYIRRFNTRQSARIYAEDSGNLGLCLREMNKGFAAQLPESLRKCSHWAVLYDRDGDRLKKITSVLGERRGVANMGGKVKRADLFYAPMWEAVRRAVW